MLFTDDSGQVTTKFMVVSSGENGTISASIGGATNPVISAIQVDDARSRLSIPVPVFIGDRVGFGSGTINDNMGFDFQAEYQTHVDVIVNGNPNETVDLELGSQRFPIERALLTYPMKSIMGGQSYDYSAGRNGSVSNVTTSLNAPNFNSGSYVFSEIIDIDEQDSSLILSDASTLLQANNWRIDTDFFLNGQTIEGTVFDLGEGVILSVDSSNILTLSTQFSDTQIELSSESIETSAWHHLTVQYQNNNLEMYIDDLLVASTPYSGITSYSSSTLTIGKDLNGQLANYSIYALGIGTYALATFSDGNTQRSVTLDANGKADVTVISTGRMAEKANVQTVSLSAGGEEYKLHALSLEFHERIVIKNVTSDVEFINALVDGLPVASNNSNALYGVPAYALSIPYTHTIDKFKALYKNGTEVAKNVWSFIPDEQFWNDLGDGLVDFTVEEVTGIANNVGEMVGELGEAIENGEITNEMKAIIALRVTMSIPIARRYIGRSVEPLMKFLKRFEGKPIAKHAAGTILRVIQPAAKGDLDPLIASIYGMLFLADMTELLISGEALELVDTINEIANGVTSAADLEGIFAFAKNAVTNLPEACQKDLNFFNYHESASVQHPLQNYFVADAYAAGGLGKILKHLKIKPLFKNIKKAKDRLDLDPDPSKPAQGKGFSTAKFLRGLGEALAVAEVADSNGQLSDFTKDLMENLIDEDIMLAMMAISHREGIGSFKSMLKGDFPLRMKAIELISAIAEIEKRISAGGLNKNSYGLPLIGQRATESGRAIKWKIRDKYGSVFINPKPQRASGNNNSKPTPYVLINKLNGDAFHLTKIASLLASGETIIGVESSVKLQFRRSNKLGMPSNMGKPLVRRVDIVTGTLEEAKWWEVKSLSFNRARANPNGTNKGVAGVSTFNLIDLSSQEKVKEDDSVVLGEDNELSRLKVKAGQFYSKEIFIDRVFAGSDPEEIPTKMQWIFQDFYKSGMPKYEPKRGAPKSYVMSLDKFNQCGFNNLPSANCLSIYGGVGKDPLKNLRRVLSGAIRKPTDSKVHDVIYRTFVPGQFLSTQEAKDYLDDFKTIKNAVIKSEKADTLGLSTISDDFCEI
jgi:hypothetical protein